MIEVAFVTAPDGRFTVELDDHSGPCHVGTVVRAPANPGVVRAAENLVSALPGLCFLTREDAKRQIERVCGQLNLSIEWWGSGT